MQNVSLLLDRISENPINFVLLAAFVAIHWLLAGRLKCHGISRNATYALASLLVSILLVLVLKYTAAYWGPNLHFVIRACLAFGISGIMTAFFRLLFIQRPVDDAGKH